MRVRVARETNVRSKFAHARIAFIIQSERLFRIFRHAKRKGRTRVARARVRRMRKENEREGERLIRER